MILLLDIGNSRIKWAWYANGRWFGDGAVARDAVPAFPFLDAAPGTPKAVLAANVAGEPVGAALELAVRQHWDVPVDFAQTRSRWGSLRNGYAQPRQLGVDRWLALVAAFDAPGQAVCVVDAGTALTVDLLEPGGAHLGGFIVPGLSLMRASLEERTGEIRLRAGPTERAADAGPGPGRDTRSAMRQGAALAAAGLVERALALLTGSPQILVTGGDAQDMLRLLPGHSQHRPRLVLEGLLRVSGPKPVLERVRVRNLFLLLLLANLLFLGWQRWVVPPAAPDPRAFGDGRTPTLTLRSSPVQATTGAGREPAVQGCTRIGPFRDANASREAADKLSGEGQQVYRYSESGEIWVGHWVQSRELSGRDEAEAALDRLARAGRRDAYIVRGESGYRISLGVFRSREGAERVAQQAREAGLVTETSDRFRTGTEYWLLLQQVDGAAPDLAELRPSGGDILRAENADCAAGLSGPAGSVSIE